MRKRAMLPILAALMVLALCVPAVSAANYPQNGQFIAYYDSDRVAQDLAPSPDGGTTFFNAGAATAATSARTSFTANDWPQFHYDEKNAGHSPSTGLPSTASLKFDRDVNAIGTVNPVVANGKIFVLTGYSGFDEPSGLTGIYLTCLNETTGDYVWNFTLPRNPPYLGSWSSPTTDGVYVYASSDNKTYCVRVSDGTEVWNFTTIGDKSCNGGPKIGGDYVFCSDWYQGHYYCLDRYTGALQWVFDSTSTANDTTYFQGTPAYDASDGSVYLTGWDSVGVLYKVNVSTGNEVWSVVASGAGGFCGSAALDDEYVYVTSYNFSGDGKLYKYDKSNGALIDSVTIEATDATPAIDEENGLVYVSGGTSGFMDPGVRCFFTGNFTELWNRTPMDGTNEDMGGWTCSVSLADGYAFVGREAGYPYCYDTVYALDAMTGATIWSYPQGGATAAIANGDVYTIGNDGHLYAFG